MIVVAANEAIESARYLSRALGCRCIGSHQVTEQTNDEFVVNYGTGYSSADVNPHIVFNKYRALQIMKRAGVCVPDFYAAGERIPRSAFPVMARNIHHDNGRDIRFIRTPDELNNINYDFVTKFIDKEREYRVHALKDKAILIVKINEREGADNKVCSNDEWEHYLYDERKYPEYARKLKELGIAARKAVGYDFGAVDIIRDRSGKFYVLEINSAPWLNSDIIDEYCRFLKAAERRAR